jgi:uncharacterized membrane protein
MSKAFILQFIGFILVIIGILILLSQKEIQLQQLHCPRYQNYFC